MKISRREFSLAGIGFILSACTDPATGPVGVASGQNLILGGGQFQDRDSGKTKHVISVVDLDARTRSLADTTFLPHGIHRKPTDMNCLAVFEKKGPGACEYDLASREVTRYIPVAKGRYFYGHGARVLVPV